jgi:hypothetical protein
MQTPQMVIAQLHQGDWLASLDLKDACFHVPIFPKHVPFLRFESLGRVFQCKVLPFGLSTALRIVAKSRDQLNQSVQLCLSVLDRAGFLINYKKSHLQPVQRILFLGMELDSIQAAAFLPLAKAQHVVECLQHFFRVGVYRPVATTLKLQSPWTKHQKSLHNNVLELLAVQKGLKVFLHKVKNRSGLVQTDNTTVLNYMNKLEGTKSPQLCQIT